MEWLLGQGYEMMCCGNDGAKQRQRRVVASPPSGTEPLTVSRGEIFSRKEPRNGFAKPTYAKSYTVHPNQNNQIAHEIVSMPSPLKLESLPISTMDTPVEPIKQSAPERRTHPDVLSLTRSHVLNSIPEEQIVVFYELMRRRQVAVGEVLAKMDDLGDSFFLVVSGELSVSADCIQSVVLQSGDFYGESAFCALVVWGWERRKGEQPGIPHYAFRKSTCVASQPSEVLEISARTVLDQEQLHPAIAHNITSIAAELQQRWGG